MAGAQTARILDGRKFLWDGRQHAAREPAEQSAESYRAEAFEARVVEEEGRFLVYTRRVVKQAAGT